MGHRKSNGKDKCGDSSPSTTLRVRMTNKNRMTNKTSNGKGKCGGPSTTVGMTTYLCVGNGRDDDLFVRGQGLG